ncbi:hypothetical protein TWF718_009645 [Orbilia javanica]|uniref:Uncharacterized protein n=1 Tax=Orbilia javanica TaxID=47235 RepID=A0AAN8MZK1_9PEZI
MAPGIALDDKPSFGSNFGTAPCRTCGDTLEVIQGKAAPYILPVGARPSALHKDFYDNIVEESPVLDPHDNCKYLCICGDPETHIHCLRCITKLINKYTKLGMSIPEVAYPESLPEPVSWKALVARLRISITTPDTLQESTLAELPCLCWNMATSTYFADRPAERLLSFLKNSSPRPPRCPHRAASRALKKGNPDVYPRSIAGGFMHDESLGKHLGLMYEQLIGGTSIGRINDSPTLIKDQHNHGHYWILKNYSPTQSKGYEGLIPEETFKITTPFTVFHERYGEDHCCHGICNGNKDPFQYAMCRLIECGYMIWLMDLGILDLPCCGKCDFEVIAVMLASSIDIADRMRDSLTGEMFNVNNYPSRQNLMALEMWKGFVVHGVDKETFCCQRTEWSCRLVRHMCIWMFCNPVYYTHKEGQVEGIMEFAQAMNSYFMNNVKRSQEGFKDIGVEAALAVDDVVRRFIGTRLVDFLAYFCA